MPQVSSVVRPHPCEPGLTFVLPSPVPCLHCRALLCSPPEHESLQAGSLLRTRVRKMTGTQETVVEGCCSDLCLPDETVETPSPPSWTVVSTPASVG